MASNDNLEPDGKETSFEKLRYNSLSKNHSSSYKLRFTLQVGTAVI